MKYISGFFFLLMVFLFWMIPFRLLYLISDLLSFLFLKVFKYRKEIVVKNLKETFIDMKESEIKNLLPGIYRNLTDVLLEGIKSFTMSKNQIVRRHKIINPEILDEHSANDKSIIGVTGHYNNWEWGSLSASLQTNFNVVALYKPLKNKLIDQYVKRNRARCGTLLAPITKTMHNFKANESIKSIYLMAADQNPLRKNAIWVSFLGRETAFLYGPAKYSRLFNYDIMYIEIERVKRGYYTIHLSLLIKDPLKYSEQEITQIYATRFEKTVLKDPKSWLWTHRRWKHKPL